MDDRFDVSADMRLVELRRSAAGKGASAPPRRWRGSNVPPSPGSFVDEEIPEVRGALLTAVVSAWPNDALIAGAIVTVTLVIENEGTEPAGDVIVVAPPPGAATYRAGSLNVNGEPWPAQEPPFAAGLELGALGPHERATLVWKLDVRPGTDPLVIAPSVRGDGVPALGIAPLRLARRRSALLAAPPPSAPPPVVEDAPAPIPDETPFYELEPEEEIIHLAADTALASIVEPAPVAPSPSPVAPSPSPVVARAEAAFFTRVLRAGDIAFIANLLQSQRSLGMLPHFLLGNALACTLDPNGTDAFGLDAFVKAQLAALNRLVLEQRMGRRPAIEASAGGTRPTIEAEMLAYTGVLARQPREQGAVVLGAPLTAPDALFVVSSFAQTDVPFIRLRQASLALQARVRLDADDPDLEAALTTYAETAKAVINRLFVRLKMDRNADVTRAVEPELDTAARAVIRSLLVAVR